MNELETTISGLREDSSFVALLQVVADVNEACSFESRTKHAGLCITWDETREPIISHTNCWNDCPLAQILEAGFRENGQLSSHVLSSLVRVRLRENLSMVQKGKFDSSYGAFMNANCDLYVSSHTDVVDVLEARWIFRQISGDSFAIPVVVR